MSYTQDPLGLTRCSLCGNAFTYDRDAKATEIFFGDPDGNWFICRFCAGRIQPVGPVEIAERLGVQRATVDQWGQRGILPPPDWTVGGRPAWRWDSIERWARETGRLKERERIAFWNDVSGGRNETVLWLERDAAGQLWLCDHGDCTQVTGDELDGAVTQWAQDVAQPGEGPVELERYDR